MRKIIGMDKKIYNICFSSSNIYIPFCISAISSLIENNKELLRDDLRIHLLSNDISEENIKLLRRLLNKYNIPLQIVDVQKFKDKIEELGIKLEFNISSVLRLFIAELLPNNDKVLFVDSDTYISNGIKELYDIDISGYPCGMVQNQPVFEKLLRECDLEKDSPYYNAGVMLINLKYWRENKIQEKLLECYKNKGHFSVDDQGVINCVLAKSTLPLPYKYNAMKPIFSCNYKRFCNVNLPQGFASGEEFWEAKKSPVIVHFNGPALRPWESWCGHPYTKQFRKHLHMHFPDFKLWKSSKSRMFVFKQYIWNRFINRIYNYIG